MTDEQEAEELNIALNKVLKSVRELEGKDCILVMAMAMGVILSGASEDPDEVWDAFTKMAFGAMKKVEAGEIAPLS